MFLCDRLISFYATELSFFLSSDPSDSLDFTDLYFFSPEMAQNQKKKVIF